MSEKKKELPPQWVPEMEGQLVAAYTDGYRIGRITKCRYDPNKEEVTSVSLVLHGGDPHTNSGFNGDHRTLDNRNSFVDKPGVTNPVLGVLVSKSLIRPLDVVVKGVLDGSISLVKPKIIEPAPTPKRDKVTQSAPAKQAEAEKHDETTPAVSKRLPRKPPPDARREAKGESEASRQPPKPQKAARKPRTPVPAVKSIEDEVAEWDTVETEPPEPADELEGFEDPPPSRPLAPADDVDPKAIPRLTAIQTTKQDELLTERLANVLENNPKLLKDGGAPGEPRWDVKCPDGSVLDVGGYGPQPADRHKPVKATVLHVVGYTAPPKGDKEPIAYMGSAMPAALVFDSIRSLCRKYEADDAPKTPAKPLPKLELSDGEEENYFGE